MTPADSLNAPETGEGSRDSRSDVRQVYSHPNRPQQSCSGSSNSRKTTIATTAATTIATTATAGIHEECLRAASGVTPAAASAATVAAAAAAPAAAAAAVVAGSGRGGEGRGLLLDFPQLFGPAASEQRDED